METDINGLVVLTGYIEMSFRMKGSKIVEMSWRNRNTPGTYPHSEELRDWGHFAARMTYFKDYWKFYTHS